MPRHRHPLTVMAALFSLALTACESAPDETVGETAPAVAPVTQVPPRPVRSDAEAPEEVVPAVQIAYAIVPPDSKGLSPGSGIAEEYRIDLTTITFEFGSAKLTQQGRAQLDELAEALSYEGAAGYRFRLAGHTDTAGPAAFNDDLSFRRAETARDYLVRTHDLEPGRLEAEGHGERMLAWPTADEVPQWRNRRVEVVNLGREG